MFKGSLTKNIRNGIITSHKLAHNFQVVPMSECPDGNIYLVFCGKIVATITNLEEDDGTRKEVQEQDNAEAEEDRPQLVGVDSADDHQRYAGYIGMFEGQIYCLGAESGKRETEPPPGTET